MPSHAHPCHPRSGQQNQPARVRQTPPREPGQLGPGEGVLGQARHTSPRTYVPYRAYRGGSQAKHASLMAQVSVAKATVMKTEDRLRGGKQELDLAEKTRLLNGRFRRHRQKAAEDIAVCVAF